MSPTLSALIPLAQESALAPFSAVFHTEQRARKKEFKIVFHRHVLSLKVATIVKLINYNLGPRFVCRSSANTVEQSYSRT